MVSGTKAAEKQVSISLSLLWNTIYARARAPSQSCCWLKRGSPFDWLVPSEKNFLIVEEFLVIGGIAVY